MSPVGFTHHPPMAVSRVRLNQRISALHVFCLLLFLLAWIACSPPADVEMSVNPEELTLFQGEKIDLKIQIDNRSGVAIRTEDNYFFSYHILTPDSGQIQFENRRFRIPTTVPPEDSGSFSLPIYFDYPDSGEYLVSFDLVHEGDFWGSSRQWKLSSSKLRLKPLVSDEFKSKYLKSFFNTNHDPVDRSQYLLRMILKNCEIKRSAGLFGFSPGLPNYPQIWIRDTATFITLAKLYYPIGLFKRIVEQFLDHQEAAGGIPDWVDAAGESGKNTVETDQESSLVLSAFEVAVEDPQWLRKPVNGIPVWRRLELALEWVWREKMDERFGLIISGLTADWGDVENTYPDQRATRWSDRSTAVFSIYTQAKFIQALKKWLKVLDFLKLPDKKKEWLKRMNNLHGQSIRHLYLEDRGYYLIHKVPSDPEYFARELDILAVGGNAEAILAGLMEPEQVRSFLVELKKRMSQYRLKHVSFTLLPPYPTGFFPHPVLNRAWTYQNGGAWDWIGARLIRALFATGFTREAGDFLDELLEKDLRQFNIFEWEDREGNGHGALFYTGAAGQLGQAILEGYFGLRQDFNGYRFRDPDPGTSIYINTNSYTFMVEAGDPARITHYLSTDESGNEKPSALVQINSEKKVIIKKERRN